MRESPIDPLQALVVQQVQHDHVYQDFLLAVRIVSLAFQVLVHGVELALQTHLLD